MARMFPQSINCREFTSIATRRLYRLFEKNLPDEFTVFYSVKWQINNFKGETQEGKTDFVITSPELGILILEVQEGEIKFNQDHWYCKNNIIEDPFSQACDSKYSFLRLLKDHPFWLNKPIVIGHAVAFPDTTIKENLGLHAPQIMVLDQPQLFRLENWTKSVMIYWQNSSCEPVELGKQAIEELIRFFNNSTVIFY
ncbi:MAG TPA: NERD nuclease [Cyanothece sp. UBA12306]|nr:NERD nuclease [Cyanothece sp. UBA12306]